jgi:hypothetical protein
MSIIHDIPAEVIPSDAVRLDRYQRALALSARLLAEAPIVPSRVAVDCGNYEPYPVTVKVYAHMDRAAVEAWHAHFGGDLTNREYSNGQIYWSATVTIDGIAVEVWTLVPPEPKSARDLWAEVEALVLARWRDRHGDPMDWCAETRAAYANTIANMRAGGAL